MVIAISVTERHEFILKDERGTDNPTKFSIRFLTASERTLLDDLGLKVNRFSDDIQVCSGSLKMTAIKAGLEGWENFPDDEGKQVEFERDKKERIILGRGRYPISDKALDRLPHSALTEVAEAIIEGTKLTEDEAKN